MFIKKIFFLLYGVLIIASCSDHPLSKPSPFLSQNLIPFAIPDSIYQDPSSPLTEEKISFGRYLFYDRRLSLNNTKSCASCHDQKFSFTDGYRRSIGALGDLHQRNSAPLLNLFLKKYLTETDSSLHYPIQQINNPLFHDHPVELGWKNHEKEILSRIVSDSLYSGKFARLLYPADYEKTAISVKESISAFVLTLCSYQSPFDKYLYLHTGSLNPSEKRGMALFYSDSLACRNCHSGFNFDTPLLKDSTGKTQYYFNTGLYNINNSNQYPDYDRGLFEITGNKKDEGVYRVPTLRNLAFTAPYYHDGSALTLEEVILNYESGGRNVTTGLYKGEGNTNIYKNTLIHGFSLTSQQRKDLINFLLALTDSSVLKNKNYANPFKNDETR